MSFRISKLDIIESENGTCLIARALTLKLRVLWQFWPWLFVSLGEHYTSLGLNALLYTWEFKIFLNIFLKCFYKNFPKVLLYHRAWLRTNAQYKCFTDFNTLSLFQLVSSLSLRLRSLKMSPRILWRNPSWVYFCSYH